VQLRRILSRPNSEGNSSFYKANKSTPFEHQVQRTVYSTSTPLLLSCPNHSQHPRQDQFHTHLPGFYTVVSVDEEVVEAQSSLKEQFQ
jgi:hypothetical protein